MMTGTAWSFWSWELFLIQLRAAAASMAIPFSEGLPRDVQYPR
jgi:hypothetical protein